MRLSCLALAAILLPQTAQAQDRRLSEGEILDLARREVVWCENYSERTRDCESLSMLRMTPEGGLVGVAMILIMQDPAIQIVVSEPVRLTGGRLCSTGTIDDMTIRATMDGQPSAQAALLARALLEESMADYADSEICQELFMTDQPGALTEIITADDERLPDFESTYRLGDMEAGFLLRPAIDDTSDTGSVSL